MKRGAPTKYKEEYINKVDEYLYECQDEMQENKLQVNLPTVEGFARYINVPKRTLYEWRAEHEDFSHSLEKIVEEQRKRLLNMGLSGSYNSTIAKLILAANHGMSDRTDVTSGGEPISVNVVNSYKDNGDNNST